jgi:chromate transporter
MELIMSDLTPPQKPSLTQAFPYWLKLGFISFGGPAGQIAMMHTDLVEKKRWISEKRFLHALNFCMLLPGPEAIQLAIYISWLMFGTAGAILAGVLFFLPAFLLLSLLAAAYLAWGHLAIMQGIFYGIKPAVVAIVLFAAWRIGSRVLTNTWLWLIALGAFLAIFALDIDFPWIVLGAAIIGYLGGHYFPQQFQARSAGHQSKIAHIRSAIIDDDSPTPSHAQFSGLKLAITTIAFILIWLSSLWLVSGQPVLTEMATFFSKAAFLTIGGAYAVLPYVYQGGVEQYTWLTAPQMMDGLALGETTPGPLIMVVTWVGYIGGVTKSVFSNSLMAGFTGAAVATFFTFLPSFFFILAGGPIVESSRQMLKLTAPLTAISAAVVGVIVNLGVFFAWHTFFPHTISWHGLDLFAVGIAMAAFMALWKYQQDIMSVIAVSAVLGLVYYLM